MHSVAVLLAVLAGSSAGAAPLRVPILTYHHIADTAEKGSTAWDISCPREVFRSHLRFLKESGYASVTFADVRAALEAKAPLPPKPVVLSFDDGDVNHWDAFEDLKAQGMKGVFFVITKMLGDGKHLTREQVKEMAEAGMEIGSHSVTHWDLKDMALSDKEKEILGSKADLEGLVGRPVISFCYPGGNYDRAALTILGRSDYWFARTTKPGISEITGRDFELKTIPIFRGTTPRRLEAKLRSRGE